MISWFIDGCCWERWKSWPGPVTFFMLYARYKLRSQRWFRIASILFFMTGVIPQVSLGILNFMAVGTVDVFTLVLVLLLLYGFTLGRRQAQRLDRWAYRRFNGDKAG
ncbi:MAG: hypothetical protein LKE51_10020 [Selenomonas sp.]|nr:hypothetical protein [Selenomonas sp.]